MIKHLITATLFALGGAGVVLVHHLAVEPLAFTHPVGELPSIAADRVPAVAAVSLEAETHPIVLAEVRITAAPRRAPKPAVLPARFDPCSELRNVGALFVDPAGASGMRNVRALCAQPDDER